MSKLTDIFGNVDDEKLIQQALTHPSYTKEKELSHIESYERLEFFGDSVLKLFTSKILYNKYPNFEEGKLSKIRSILVSDAILFKVATEIGIEKLIILGVAEEKQGGRKRESNIACATEALLGAYYLNGKINEIEKFINDYIIPFADDIDQHFEKYNAKDILQQYTQSIDKTLPEYNTVNIIGPAHKPEFEVEIIWQGNVIARAKGKSKKEAQQNCAYQACLKLGAIEELTPDV